MKQRTKKVLVVDDIIDNITFLSFDLEDDGFEVVSALSGEECLQKALSESPDVILLDVQMPGMDGIETLQHLKVNPSTNDIPVIMISANAEDDNVIQAIDFDAHDFVAKPITYQVLAARMRSALRLSDLVKDLEQANIELNKLATLDPLTNCYNRRQFFKLAHREAHKSQRHNRPLGFMMIDVDFFKKINDSYGHSFGDEVLRTLVETAEKECREYDILGRLGGEEFALCCPETDYENTLQIAERIRSACEEMKITPRNETTPIEVTISIGVVEMAIGESLDTALNRADKNLYEAKKNGRNRCVG